MANNENINYHNLSLNDICLLFNEAQTLDELEIIKNKIFKSINPKKVKFYHRQTSSDTWSKLIYFEYKKRQAEIIALSKKNNIDFMLNTKSLEDLYQYYGIDYNDVSNPDWLSLYLAITYLKLASKFNITDEGKNYYLIILQEIYKRNHGLKLEREEKR